MKLVVTNKGEIISYITIGDLDGSIEYKGTIPDDFEENFKPSFYLLQNDAIVLNQNYVEPKPTIPSGPTAEQVMINQLGLKYAELSAKVDKLEGGGSNG
ncbi:DUF2977 domain-containing protein [Latilactobacillus sp. 5-91]|uniref:DUF2977 domain-containing protein n=1 Tax=Latilactobacillus sp. 5-91 TaxID=3410924 RepID=UPI003C77FA62